MPYRKRLWMRNGILFVMIGMDPVGDGIVPIVDLDFLSATATTSVIATT